MNDRPHSAFVLSQNYGKVQVTSDELVIEGQHWDISILESLTILTEHFRPGEGQSAFYVYEPALQRRLWPTALLFLIAMVVFTLLRESILFMLGFLPGVVGVLYLLYVLNKYPQEVYGLRLRLKRDDNSYSETVPKYRWRDRPSAQRVVAAVEKARHTKSGESSEATPPAIT